MNGAGRRQAIARRVPGPVRKLVRMVEHFGRRHMEWADVLLAMRGVSGRDKLTLYGSAALAPLTSLRRLDGFEPPLLVRDAALRVDGIGTFKVRAGTDDIIHILAAREAGVFCEVTARLRPGDTFVDAGANIGLYSILAARLVGPTGQVIAIEMMPPTATRLRAHVAGNAARTIRVIERALSDRDDDRVVATSAADKFGQASIVADHTAARTVKHEVATVRLDTALADVGRVALIKMDLEGAEFLALSGATAVLRRTDAILFESNEHDERVMRLLRSSGFALTSVSANDYLAVRERG